LKSEIRGPIPAIGEAFAEKQLQLPYVGRIVIEIPFTVERRNDRDFAPLRECVPQFHTGPFVERFTLFNIPVLIKIELEPIRQTNFDFVPESVLILPILKFRRPETIDRDGALPPHGST